MRVWSGLVGVVWLASACASEALQLKAAADAQERDLLVIAPDASVQEGDCVDRKLVTEGQCELTLPPEQWVQRLDCRALLRIGSSALECGGPDGWRVEDDRLLVEGKSCRTVQAEPHRELEVFIPCSLF